MIIMQVANLGLNVDFGGMFSTIVMGATIGAAILAIIVIGYLMNYFFMHNISVLLFEETNQGNRILTDRGRIDYKNSDFKVLRYKNFEYFVPMSQHFFMKGNAKMLYGKVKDNSVSWMTITENDNFIPADINMKVYAIQRWRRTFEATATKKTFWQEHGHEVLLVLMMIILFICIILILKEVRAAIEMGRAIGSAAVQAKTQVL